MLRVYFMRYWFSQSDPGMEEALSDSRVMRDLAGIDLDEEAVPDESTILKFRHLLEAKNMSAELLRLVNVYLNENGLKVSRDTDVDETIINAPILTKNRVQACDPDMRQTKKGNQRYFGMMLFSCVDSKTRLVHSAVAAAANVHDSQGLDALLHGKETRVWSDSAYAGQIEAMHRGSPCAQDFTRHKASRYRVPSAQEWGRNRTNSKTRSRVEHVFHVLKCRFAFTKVRYRELEKNANHLFASIGAGQSGDGKAAVLAGLTGKVRRKCANRAKPDPKQK